MRFGFAALTGTLAAAILSSLAVAQDAASDDSRRERIGLVLSGGGARGGAHLGVIRALEELRVPVDVIAGTSIGSAIGGLYASGMTVEDINVFIDGIDWDAAFLNSTPRQLKSWQRKREDDLFLLQVATGVDDQGFTLPLGVVSGQVIDTVMARITLPVALVDDFDELAIPFRAVATDIATGEAVILDGGNLGRAIRASMAVPAALTPIEIDGRLLVDGGIAMNLPVAPALALGAERIIAIDISEALTAQDQINSLLGITTQLTTLLTAGGTREQIALLDDDDILLRPEFDDEYSSVSFARLAATVDTGYETVMAQRELFEPLQLSPEDYAAWKASLPDPRASAMPVVDFVDLGDTRPLDAGIVSWRMQELVTGQPLDIGALETGLNRVYGLGVYTNVRYGLVERDDAQGIQLELVHASPDAERRQQTYGLGLSYSSASDEDPLFGLAASILRVAINDRGGEWRASFLLGDEPGFNGYYNQPFGSKGLSFFSPSLGIGSRQLNLFEDNRLVAEYKMRAAVFEFAAGREFMDRAELRGGMRVGAGDTRLHVGQPGTVPYDDYHLGEMFTRLSVDTFDNVSFPTRGTLATMEWRGANESLLGADHDYDQLLISAAHARTWGRLTLLSSLRFDATISGQAPAYTLFGFGGFRDMSGLNRGEFTGQHVARLGASVYRPIGDLALFQVYVGADVQVGNAFETRDRIGLDESIWGGSIWAGVDTPVGPAFLALGTAEGGDDAFYVYLGRVF